MAARSTLSVRIALVVTRERFNRSSKFTCAQALERMLDELAGLIVELRAILLQQQIGEAVQVSSGPRRS
jgi:hypothetical protein